MYRVPVDCIIMCCACLCATSLASVKLSCVLPEAVVFNVVVEFKRHKDFSSFLDVATVREGFLVLFKYPMEPANKKVDLPSWY